jgi:hypothetical protein
LHDPEFAWYVWDLMEAFHWNFLPSQLLAEDESLMDDLFTISQMESWVGETAEIERMSSWTEQDKKLGDANTMTAEMQLPR